MRGRWHVRYGGRLSIIIIISGEDVALVLYHTRNACMYIRTSLRNILLTAQV